MITLNKLLLKNFKSFRNAEIPLKQGLTAIVGENGHGKSNIADAMLFVLGETSMKLLRAPRMSDLINYTSKEKLARVTLEFEHKKTKHEISRIIDSEGKSFYRWNGKRATMSEIVSFLEDIGLKTDYNIILQNTSTKVLDIGGEQRRKMIEDIAGISEYEEKKQEALKNLEVVERRLRDINIVYAEKNTLLSELKKDKEIAETAMELEGDIKKIRAQLISHRQHHLKEESKEYENQEKELEKEIGTLDLQKQNSLKEINSLKEKLELLEKNLFETFEKEHSELSSQLSKHDSLFYSLQKEISISETTLQQKNISLQEIDERTKSGKEEIEKISSELQEMKNRQSSLSLDFQELKKQEKEKDVSILFEKIDSLEKQLSEITDSLSKEKEHYFENTSRQASIKEQRERLMKQFSLSEKTLKETEEEILKRSSLLKELSQLENNLKKKQSLEQDYLKILSLLEQSKAKRKEYEKRLSELSQAKSNCPTCERPLAEKKKKDLQDSLSSEISQLKQKEKTFQQNMEQIKNNIEQLEKLSNKASDLRTKTADFNFLKEKKSSLSSELQNLKTTISNLDSEAKKFQILNITEKISDLEKKQSSLRENLSAIRGSKEILAREELSKKLSFFTQELAALEERIKITSQHIQNLKEQQIKLKNQKAFLSSEISNLKEKIKQTSQQSKTSQQEKDKLEKRIKELEKSKEKDLKERTQEKKKLSIAEQNYASIEIKLKKKESEFQDIKLLLSSFKTKEENLQDDFLKFSSFLSKKFSSYSMKELEQLLEDNTKRREAIGNVNYKAIEKYSFVYEEFGKISEKIEIVQREKEVIEDMIEKIELKRDELFMNTLNEINKHFSQLFEILFEGKGELILSNPEKPFESELIFHGSTPLKTYRSIEEMSGGEKALTASAFLFAISLYRPSPFYFFDEMDAPLDKKRSERFAKLLQELSSKNQLITITHNNVVLSKADQLIGVGIGKDGSSLITLEL